MYCFMYKNAGDTQWNYSDWEDKISNFANKYRSEEFVILDENYMIVYSS